VFLCCIILKGSELAWAMCLGVTINIAGTAPNILNQADISRWARKPGDQTWPQLIGAPITGVVIVFMWEFLSNWAAA
jgi:cytosine/uracil/thiamine/allantoin permease